MKVMIGVSMHYTDATKGEGVAEIRPWVRVCATHYSWHFKILRQQSKNDLLHAKQARELSQRRLHSVYEIPSENFHVFRMKLRVHTAINRVDFVF